jgi:hypothetical protein
MALDWSESAVVETMPGKISGAQTISIHAPLELVRFRKRGTHSAGVGRVRPPPQPPCRHIPRNDAGFTIDTYYHLGRSTRLRQQ